MAILLLLLSVGPNDYQSLRNEVSDEGGAGLVILHRGGESLRSAHLFLQRLDDEGINFAREPALLDLRTIRDVPRLWNLPSDAWWQAYLGVVKKYQRNNRVIAGSLYSSGSDTHEIMTWWIHASRRHGYPLAWDMYDNAP